MLHHAASLVLFSASVLSSKSCTESHKETFILDLVEHLLTMGEDVLLVEEEETMSDCFLSQIVRPDSVQLVRTHDVNKISNREGASVVWLGSTFTGLIDPIALTLGRWFLPESFFRLLRLRLDSKVFFFSGKLDSRKITERYTVQGKEKARHQR